jgi:hypothetical protein
MPVSSTARGTALFLTIVLGSSGLKGCASGDVEFNGKIFEMVGLAGDQGGGRDPKTQPRAPLVLPPDRNRLPEPGAGASPIETGANPAWPNDRDARKLADGDARKRAQEQYCRDGNWKQKAHGKDIEAAQGPEGSCHGNIFTWMSKGLTGNSD